MAILLADAEEAFKRLSDAYECLSDVSTQQIYLQSLNAPRPSSSSSSSSSQRPRGPPAYPRKRKRSKPTEQSTADATDTQESPCVRPPRRQRTPEEIWRAFQEEEERMARDEFFAKGFERTYAETSDESSSKRRRGAKAPKADPPVDLRQEKEQREATDRDADVHERAQSWRDWRQTRASSPSPDALPRAPDAVKTPSTATICCLLCRRKFPTDAALQRHEALSALHKANAQRRRDAQAQPRDAES